MPTKTESTTSTRKFAQEWREALITKEDPLHVHKTLGILCLLSFVWRFAEGGGASDMGFALYPDWTLPTLALHLLLNVSSFEFAIPPKRINSGFRIWPEYRWHSLIFLSRSLACLALRWYEIAFAVRPLYQGNFLIVMATITAADLASQSVGRDASSGFARQLQAPHGVKFFFSVLQFHATAGCLLPFSRSSIHFVFCTIIQVNAFLMTLRRKNLAGHYLLISLYGLLLVGGYMIGTSELFLLGTNTVMVLFLLGNTAAFVRLFPRGILPGFVQSKYVIWPCIYWFMLRLFPLLFPTGNTEQDVVKFTSLVPGLLDDLVLAELGLFCAASASLVAVIALGYYKSVYDYPRMNKKGSNSSSKAMRSSADKER